MEINTLYKDEGQMTKKKLRKADFCVIGAGSGGLSFAAGAVQMGASVILVERGKMGGDCLNYGCVPSKALLAAAKFAHEFKRSEDFGWAIESATVDFKRVHQHVHKVMAAIAPHDSVDRFERLGVNIILGKGAFQDKETLETPRHIIKAKRFIIASGSSPFVPPVEGLHDIPYYTNETIFDLQKLPEHLVVIGGGPIGIEMAQAFSRLGSEVTVLEAFNALPKDDPEFTVPLLEVLHKEGIVLKEKVKISNVTSKGKKIEIAFVDSDEKSLTLSASHLLVAAGRRPNVQDMNLEAAGIEFSPKGIKINRRLQTSNPRIYAIGDCTGGYQFTHVAGYHAGLVLRNSIFRLRAKVQTAAIPWVTYTDPELAHVGATEAQLLEKKIRHQVLSYSFDGNDRAQTDRKTTGKIKVLVTPKGNILGTTILGNNAGELIFPWVMAIQNKLKISSIANTIAPYPTLSEGNKRVAGSYYTAKIFSPFMHRVVKQIMKFTR
jgi:pyruvate/2-oxoglutarate dehydrogenase complex dihydrolipoamide dehydrogenase (E3) component